MSYFGETNSSSRSQLLLLVVGVVVGALVMGLAWLAHERMTSSASPSGYGPGPTAVLGPPSPPSSPPGTTPSHTSSNAPVAEDQASADLLSRCQDVYAGQQRPLTTAAASMAQWQVHIGAMNKLVVGAISLQQATQFWNQTRVGAHAKLAAFAAADRAFAQRTERCPPPSVVPHPDETLSACSRAVAARGRVLHRARVALATWRMHVHHMEMLRNGTMSPQRATTLWLRSWHQGQAQVNDYRAAVRAAHARVC